MGNSTHPQPAAEAAQVLLTVDGIEVAVPESASLLDALRSAVGNRSVKDGCSPQGQCGCCTVLVDGQPRVSCVTPVRRVRGRAVTTIVGLDEASRWADAISATGGSQCGFCTPGIIVRLAALERKHGSLTPTTVRDALKAHLCRCTGWQTIVEAAVQMPVGRPTRDRAAAETRAAIEGHTPQAVAPSVALGNAGFADDDAPSDALVALRGADDTWVVGETLVEARAAAQKVQGRRTTIEASPPIAVPEGDWALTLQTTWVEPAYLETDASWCVPGGEPASVLANGGAFGAKMSSEAPLVAKRLAEAHGRPVRVLFTREDATRLGAKRPPMAAGVRADGTGVAVVARTAGVVEAIASVAPGFEVREVDVTGPPTSAEIRGSGWVEAAVLLHAATGAPVVSPDGATATASLDDDRLLVHVRCGEPLDDVVLRSYCIGAAHMAYSWVTSESLAVDPAGGVHDLTIRSFGVVRAVDTPTIDVVIDDVDGPPTNGSDAVFAAVAAEVWRARGHAPVWPTG